MDLFARTHQQKSNRKAREDLEKKRVFRSVLENPLYVPWPSVPLNVQNQILARTVDLVGEVAEYRQKIRDERTAVYLKNQRSRKKAKRLLRRTKASQTLSKTAANPDPLNIGESHSSIPSTLGNDGNLALVPDDPPLSLDKGPAIMHGLFTGINEVTKKLERQCASAQGSSVPIDSRTTSFPEPASSPTIGLILVCRADVDPPLLTAHIPYLAAACNAHANSPERYVKLVPLPKSAEATLAHALGLRRTAVLALDRTIVEKDPLLVTLLGSVPHILAPWLRLVSTSKRPAEQPDAEHELIPTHVKQLQSTAPKDMRAAKELRSKARGNAKQIAKLRLKQNRKAQIASKG